MLARKDAGKGTDKSKLNMASGLLARDLLLTLSKPCLRLTGMRDVPGIFATKAACLPVLWSPSESQKPGLTSSNSTNGGNEQEIRKLRDSAMEPLEHDDRQGLP
jgi:hypothetical protein